MANTDVVTSIDVDEGQNSSHGFGRTVMLQRLLRTPRADVEIGVAIPVGCMVPLAIAAAVLVGAGVFLGTRLTSQQGLTTSLCE
jgi:hypothetical protein